MIVCDFDIVGVSVPPHEAHSPLLVDPNAVLSLAIAFEGLQPVARWDPKVSKVHGAIQHEELAVRGTPQLSQEPLDRFPPEQGRGLLACKGPDHMTNGTRARRYCQVAILSASNMSAKASTPRSP